jgi:hypothetical protein
MALETITSQHRDLQQISIHVPYILSYALHGGGTTTEWIDGTQRLELDHLLVQFWDLRSIRPKVMYSKNQKRGIRDLVVYLLPEITKRGIIDLVEESSGSR